MASIAPEMDQGRRMQGRPVGVKPGNPRNGTELRLILFRKVA